MTYEDNFPYETYRKYQRGVLKQVEKSFGEGKDNFILEAPPGFGKSAVNVAVAKSFKSAYIVTTQKVLQDIYKTYGLPIIKGRSNYICPVTEKSSDMAPCTFVRDYLKDEGCDYLFEGECPYNVAKQECVESDVCVMNLSYAFILPYPFEKRDLLIVDEAHNIDNLALDYATMSFSRKLLGEEVPTLGSIEEYAEYLSDAIPKLKEMVKKEQNKYEKVEDEAYVRSIKRIEKLIDKISVFSNDVKDGNQWIVERSKWNIKFTPVTVDRFVKDILWWKGDKTMCSTATVLDGKIFKNELGIEGKAGFVSVPSSFPKQNRPVYFLPVGLMSYKKKEETMPFMADMIGRICKKYGGENVIVHANSYDNARMLSEIIKTDKEIIFQEQSEREASLRQFVKGSNKLFISVKMTEGIDLIGDKCRVNIISKIAFPSMADERIKERIKMEDGWYDWKTVIELLQAIGRTTRSDTDRSDTYILDSSFGFLHSKNKHLFPKWFEEAIQWNRKPFQIYDKGKVVSEINKLVKELGKEYGDVYLSEIQKETHYSNLVISYALNTLEYQHKITRPANDIAKIKSMDV